LPTHWSVINFWEKAAKHFNEKLPGQDNWNGSIFKNRQVVLLSFPAYIFNLIYFSLLLDSPMFAWLLSSSVEYTRWSNTIHPQDWSLLIAFVKPRSCIRIKPRRILLSKVHGPNYKKHPNGKQRSIKHLVPLSFVSL
jgi:hypothetical protein